MVGDGETFLTGNGWEGFCVCDYRLLPSKKENAL